MSIVHFYKVKELLYRNRYALLYPSSIVHLFCFMV